MRGESQSSTGGETQVPLFVKSDSTNSKEDATQEILEIGDFTQSSSKCTRRMNRDAPPQPLQSFKQIRDTSHPISAHLE